MSFDNAPELAVILTTAEQRRLSFGRFLFLCGWITDVCEYRGGSYKLPAPPIVGQPTFPIGALPDRVDGA